MVEEAVLAQEKKKFKTYLESPNNYDMLVVMEEFGVESIN
jgi:hypothetical protein